MMESRRSLLWKYFAVCEDDTTKAECTICKKLSVSHINDLRSFSFSVQQLFIFNQILQWNIHYSAKYWKSIFGTALHTTHTTVYDTSLIISSLALLTGQQTCDSQVSGSSPGWATFCSGLGQATYTYMTLSPSSIAWYRPRGWPLWLEK